jgi:predicted 2-oxoglutarate/Fe(II)-dependent dioxygenase YbiX
VLNLPTDISQYCLSYEKVIPNSLINVIDQEIYNNKELWEDGRIGGDFKNSKRHDIRSVKVCGLFEQNIGTSIGRRIIFNDLKRITSRIEETYKKQVSGFYDSKTSNFQFLHYDSKMHGHYIYHVDHSFANPRNLTILIGLSSAEDYKGGKLFIANDKEGIKLDKGQAVAFPSNFMFPHKVERVEEGERKVLVIWTM